MAAWRRRCRTQALILLWVAMVLLLQVAPLQRFAAAKLDDDDGDDFCENPIGGEHLFLLVGCIFRFTFDAFLDDLGVRYLGFSLLFACFLKIYFFLFDND